MDVAPLLNWEERHCLSTDEIPIRDKAEKALLGYDSNLDTIKDGEVAVANVGFQVQGDFSP